MHFMNSGVITEIDPLIKGIVYSLAEDLEAKPLPGDRDEAAMG